MKNEIYDVLVVGGTCYPVPRAVTEWLQTFPAELEKELSIVEDFPNVVLDLFDREEIEAMSDDDYSFKPGLQSNTTCGSWENDRVLHMVPFLMGFDDMGYVREWISKNDFKLGEELEYFEY